MDPDAQQGDAQVTPIEPIEEAPQEDAPVMMPPEEPAQLPPDQSMSEPVPEPEDDAAPVIAPNPTTPPLPTTESVAPQVSPQTVPPEPPDEDVSPVSGSAPIAAPIVPTVSPLSQAGTEPKIYMPAPHIDLATLERMGEAAHKHSMEVRIERLVAYAAKKGHLTRRDVQLLLRVGRSTAQNYLNKLVTEGHLDRRGAGHSTVYWWKG